MSPDRTQQVLDDLDAVLSEDWAKDLIEHYEHDHPDKARPKAP